MTPVRSPGRRVAILLGIALTLTLAFAAPVLGQDALGVPADAPTPGEGKITRVHTIGVIEADCPAGAPAPCWDTNTLVANPGDVVVIHANLQNSAVPHNLHANYEGGPKSSIAGEALHTIAFTMPESGEVEYICDVHPQTMKGTIVTPVVAATAGGAAAAVPTLGVHFLAYWVGVIAFAILFVVYGATFFLFKYNETRATTDHWDRSETPGESKRLAAVAPLLAVVIAVAAIAGIVYITMR